VVSPPSASGRENKYQLLNTSRLGVVERVPHLSREGRMSAGSTTLCHAGIFTEGGADAAPPAGDPPRGTCPIGQHAIYSIKSFRSNVYVLILLLAHITQTS